MRWSQLKSRIESLFAPSLAGRVTLHQARYRHAAEEVGRVWIALDGREVADFATHKGWPRVRARADELMDDRSAWGSTAAYAQVTREAEMQLHSTGTMSDSAALSLLEQFLAMPIDAALHSANPLVRTLALLDRRVGKRRLRAVHIDTNSPAFVRDLYAARCLAERLTLRAPAV